MLVHREREEDIFTYTPTQAYELVMESNYSFGIFLVLHTMDHDMLLASSERCHKKTSIFHLIFVEMTIKLDVLSYLLHIKIERRRLNHHTKISLDMGLELMIELVGVVELTVIEECLK